MTPFLDLNAHKYLYLLRLEATELRSLRLIVAEGIVSDRPSLVSVDEAPDQALRDLITQSRSIDVTSESAIYDIQFEDYVAYSVFDESYTIALEGEAYSGSIARIYSQSKYLEYIFTTSIASDEYPGPFKHYGLCCSDHTLDIAALEEPRVVRRDTG